MKIDERNEWLKTLNIGDEVAYSTGRMWSSYVIAKITRITPKRMFSLSNGTMVNVDGSIRGNKYFYIHPVTDKIRMDIWRNRTIMKIRNNLKVDKLSNDQLKVLLQMLDA